MPRRTALHYSQLVRYSRWDGSQQLPPLHGDRVLGAMGDDLLASGDLGEALRRLLARGLPGTGPTPPLPGLRDLLRHLRSERQQRLDRHDPSGLLDQLRARLEDILAQERQRIAAWRDGQMDGAPGADEPGGGNADDPLARDLLKGIADRSAAALDALPDDLAPRVRALEDYEFLDPQAQKDFLRLLEDLRQGATDTFFRDLGEGLRNLDPDSLERMKQMTRALNAMLVRRIAGEDPGFEDFMRNFGDLFGPDPPQDLDALLEQLAQRMAAMQGLMDQLSPAQRRELAELLSDRLQDPELQRELIQLGKELQFLLPDLHRHAFRGGGDLGLDGALDLMRELQDMDRLEAALRDALRSGNLDGLDSDALRELLGDDAAAGLDQLRELLQALEDAGHVRHDNGELQLTPRGNRRLARNALAEVFARLQQAGLGQHDSQGDGRGGEPTGAARPWTFGDAFDLHLPATLRSGLARQGPGTPLRLAAEDFQVHRREPLSRTATALLIDLSWSMALRDTFGEAKKVALALAELINSRYRHDQLYLVGFSAYAHEIDLRELPGLVADEYTLGTNMQQALDIAERLLARHAQATRQVLMISDGEPTSHIEHGRALFAYPPSTATLQATLRQVRRCTRRGITINTFMLEQSPWLRGFMDEVARLNGGRVFYTDAHNLGAYVLHDYVQQRRRAAG